MLLYACSTNRGKLKEFGLAARAWGRPDLIIESLPNLSEIVPPEESGGTYQENASLKALYYSRYTSELVLADDSGLEVAALGNAPGIYSARYAGLGADDAANNELLLRSLEDEKDRSARFVCVLALATAGEIVGVISGTVEGEILHERRGNSGFGYDPLFFHLQLERSFGELSDEEKLSVSARGKTLRELFEGLGKKTASSHADGMTNSWH